jgi:secretion/DNA translocation related CpaE-like protein
MARTRRPVTGAAARLAGDGEPPDTLGRPAAPLTPSGRPRPHPLFVTADAELLDDLLRLAAQAGVTPDVAPDPADARPWYAQAARVFIGADMAEPCARAGLPRRSGVVLVMRSGSGTASDGVDDVPWGVPDLPCGEQAPAWMASPHHSSSDIAPPGWEPVVGSHGASASGGRAASGEDADAWRIAHWLGADHVAVLPAAEAWLSDQIAAMTSGVAPGRVVAVVGGRGGAGASVLAGALAVTAARRGLRTMLIDGDPLGGGVDLVLGWESLDGLRWPALSQASGRVPAPALVDALPGRSELVVLSWDRGEPTTVPPEAMLAALDAGRRGRDLTVVDLPRRVDDSSTLALRGADQVYLVVPAELRACAAAGRVAATVGPHCAALSVVVRAPAAGGLAVKDVVAALGLPYAGTIRSDPRVRSALERGEPPAAAGHGPLAALCERLLDVVLPIEGAA